MTSDLLGLSSLEMARETLCGDSSHLLSHFLLFFSSLSSLLTSPPFEPPPSIRLVLSSHPSIPYLEYVLSPSLTLTLLSSTFPPNALSLSAWPSDLLQLYSTNKARKFIIENSQMLATSSTASANRVFLRVRNLCISVVLKPSPAGD